jgi:hypothetical protein
VGAKIVDIIPFCSGSLFFEPIARSFSASLNLTASGDSVMVGAESPFTAGSLGELGGVGIRGTHEKKECDVSEHADTGGLRVATFAMSDDPHVV